MTDKKDNPLIESLKKDWEVYFTEDFINIVDSHDKIE